MEKSEQDRSLQKFFKKVDLSNTCGRLYKIEERRNTRIYIKIY